MSDRLRGYLYTLIGVLIITPDAMLLRLIEAEPWTIMFWRGLGFFVVQMLIVLWRHRLHTLKIWIETGRYGIVIALTMAIGQILFVFSIHHTDAANTLVIIAAIPLATALLGYLWFGESMEIRTICVGFFVLLAVGLTMGGGLLAGGALGDVAALGVVICLAVLFNCLRRSPAKDLLPAIASSGLLSAMAAYFMADTVVATRDDLPLLLILCLFVSPVSFALISAGPKYLPAPEVGLLLLLETALGPVWVWLALNEIPSDLTIIGGVLMLATLAVNSWLLLREEECKAAMHK